MRRPRLALLTSQIFLLAVFVIFPLGGCNEKKVATSPPPPKDCWDPFAQRDTCLLLPRVIDRNAAWSPDGRTIAFVRGGIDSPGVYLIDTSGSNARRLVPAASAIQPAFSPDGQWVAFANLADGGIYKIKLNGDSSTQLTSGRDDQEPAWSPNGEWILFTNYTAPNLGIWIMNKSGASQKFLVQYGGTPSWLNDATRFICGAFVKEQDTFGCYLAIFSRIDSSFKKVSPCGSPDSLTIGYPEFNSDNSRILLTGGEPTNDQVVSPTYLYVMDSTGQNLQKLLVTLSREGAWSPDGSRIVYTDTRPEYGTLFVMDADGSNRKQLTFGN